MTVQNYGSGRIISYIPQPGNFLITVEDKQGAFITRVLSTALAATDWNEGNGHHTLLYFLISFDKKALLTVTHPQSHPPN